MVSRDLMEREREALEAMLAGQDFPGADAYREQISWTRVTSTCGCGQCASIDLEVDRRAPQAPFEFAGEKEVLVTAGTATLYMLAFAKDGWLVLLEGAPTSQHPVHRFPPADVIEARPG